MVGIIISLFEKGILFTFLIIGIYISSKVIRFDNMSIEGAFNVGGAVAAITLNNYWNPLMSIFFASFCAGVTGLVTAFLYEKLGINRIMSGIIVTTGLFSVVLILATSNLCIANEAISLFSFWRSYCIYDLSIIMLSLFIFFVIGVMKLFLCSKMGLLLYTVGCNRQFLITIGRSPEMYIFLGLFLSNFFAGMSHALFVHYLGYFSIWFSSGILIIALAGMVLADLVTIAFDYGLILGGVLYQAILVLTINFHIHPDWNRLITAMLIVGVLLVKDENNMIVRERL